MCEKARRNARVRDKPSPYPRYSPGKNRCASTERTTHCQRAEQHRYSHQIGPYPAQVRRHHHPSTTVAPPSVSTRVAAQKKSNAPPIASKSTIVTTTSSSTKEPEAPNSNPSPPEPPHITLTKSTRPTFFIKDGVNRFRNAEQNPVTGRWRTCRQACPRCYVNDRATPISVFCIECAMKDIEAMGRERAMALEEKAAKMGLKKAGCEE